jgi:aryl-alcohol dehydrogenase-like predicted oxidoreductase
MWQDSDEAKAMATPQKAVQLGVNFFDTAFAYGEGRSEQLVEKLVGSKTEKFYIFLQDVEF